MKMMKLFLLFLLYGTSIGAADICKFLSWSMTCCCPKVNQSRDNVDTEKLEDDLYCPYKRMSPTIQTGNWLVRVNSTPLGEAVLDRDLVRVRTLIAQGGYPYKPCWRKEERTRNDCTEEITLNAYDLLRFTKGVHLANVSSVSFAENIINSTQMKLYYSDFAKTRSTDCKEFEILLVLMEAKAYQAHEVPLDFVWLVNSYYYNHVKPLLQQQPYTYSSGC